MAFTPKFTLFELTTRVATPVVKINLRAAQPRPKVQPALMYPGSLDRLKHGEDDAGSVILIQADGIEVAEQLCIHHAATMPV